jgi:hypothetical protein
MADNKPDLEFWRGGELLGTIIHLPAKDDFPWRHGTFTPTAAFEEIRELFVESRELLKAQNYDAWDELWADIEDPGLQLVWLDDGRVEEDCLIHIVGTEVDWR